MKTKNTTVRRRPLTTAGKIRFDAAKAVKLYQAGKRVADIAVMFGYERGHGQNRVRAALTKVGVYEKVRQEIAKKPARPELVVAVPAGADVLAQECYRVVESRYKQLHGRQRTGWIEKLCGMLLAGMGETAARKIAPVSLPQGLHVLRSKAIA